MALVGQQQPVLQDQAPIKGALAEVGITALAALLEQMAQLIIKVVVVVDQRVQVDLQLTALSLQEY